ncbi:flippase [Lacticaseibacillus baoqingensis]|uniref:Flippase n=1 Tax=Lacticaseibacillus baoqingensis TaxID=2486013 RepID=A0ABW4E3W2_9LACO|nr:flippase [Lacticaseibacillus baoqingensis]
MKVIKNFLWNAGYQVFVLIVPLITVPYVNRVLGPTGVGINAFTNSVVQYFILLGSLGINLYGNRETAYRRDRPEQLAKLFWEIALIRFICIGLSVLIYLAFVFSVDRYRVFYLAQGLMLVAAAFDISWFFQGLENFRVTVLRNIFVRLASLVMVFTFVKTANDTGLYIVIIAGSQLAGNLTFWPSIRRYVHGLPKLSELHLVRHLRPSLLLLVPQLATQIYLQLNKTMLGMLQGVTASGFYDNSDKIIKMLLAIVTATGTVLLPHVAHSFANGDKAAVHRSLETSMHVVLVMAFPLALGISSVSDTFTYYFFSAKFMPVAQLMAVESIVVIPIAIASAVGVQYLLPTNQMRPYTTSVVLGSIANIILNVPLILLWGTMGAVIATILSESIVTGYQVYYVRRQIKLRRLFSEAWKYLAASVIMYAVIRVLDHVLGQRIVALVIEVLVGMGVYVVALLLLRPRVILGYVQEFMHKRHA